MVGGSDAGTNPDISLKPGTCMRINTGAPIPNGANAVVQVEDTELIKASDNGSEELEIKILVAPSQGQDIRKVGSDIPQNSLVLKQGTQLGPAELGLLATVGAVKVETFEKPKVGLLSTGNELQDPSDEVLRPGAIRDSNKTTLRALLEEAEFDFLDCGIAIDEPNALLQKLVENLSKIDVLVTTGGVSMGDRDLLRQVLVQDLGAKIHFARVHMKPGKPTTLATLDYQGQKKIILGLPGNPVSAFVTAQLYLLPACRYLQGLQQAFPAKVQARLPCDCKLDPRPEYVRSVLSWKHSQAVAEVEMTGNQISSRLLSCSAANGLLILPPKSEDIQVLPAGTVVDAMIIGALRNI